MKFLSVRGVCDYSNENKNASASGSPCILITPLWKSEIMVPGSKGGIPGDLREEIRKMRARMSFNTLGALAAFGAVVLVGMLSSSRRLQAQDNYEAGRVQQGYAINPVPLNLAGRDYNLVGLGSYLVNAVGDCNGCHSSGAPPLGLYPYTTGGNPYFSQKEKIDPAVFLNGGAPFGMVGTPTGPSGYAGPVIITRNLTPDKNGLPEGGHTLAQFMQIMKEGTDFDHIHPTCTAAQIATILTGATPVCIPTGPIVYDAMGDSFNNIPNGNLLQIMPWVTFSHMTDRDITAIYEYLSAIPCIDNSTSTPPAGAPNELRNDCGSGKPAPAAVKESGIQQPALSRRAR
jgi:hypothetical protein